MRKIDLESWPRKEHFEFFNTFDEPFFSIVSNVDCTVAKQSSKKISPSFFLRYLYLALQAMNHIEEFRLRIKEDAVYCYDTVHASSTVNRDDGTFGFSYIKYHDDFSEFLKDAQQEVMRVRKTVGLDLSVAPQNVIHVSALPWISFTGLTHARHFAFKDSIPKLSFGKIFEQQQRLLMPVSVTVNHAVADGYHVGLFFEKFQELLGR